MLLSWAKTAPNIAGAFEYFSAAVDQAGRDNIPVDVRDSVCEQLQNWDGKSPGLSQHWVEQAIKRLDETSKAAGPLVLFTAIAPNQVDNTVVHASAIPFPRKDKLLSAMARGTLTAARRVGTWLYAPFQMTLNYTYIEEIQYEKSTICHLRGRCSNDSEIRISHHWICGMANSNAWQQPDITY